MRSGIIVIMVMLFLLFSIKSEGQNKDMKSRNLPSDKSILKEDKARLDAVKLFADNVLKKGRDRYRTPPSPLFADGISIDSGEHVKWIFPGKKELIISDMALQQNLFRTLTALTNLTGDAKYKSAAVKAVKYMFDNFTDKSGLIYWGGHRFIDLKTLKVAGPNDRDTVHELKNNFPYYELMFEVNKEATVKYIKALWNAHMYDWAEINIGRHGAYGKEMGKLWNNELVDKPPFRESTGLSFINAGNDMIYAASLLYKFNGDGGALKWAKHLAYQYVVSRNQKTGLGAYQFTQPKKRAETKDDNDTESKYGDRAKRQFGPEFGAVALEGNILNDNYAGSIYAENALMQFQFADDLGAEAKDILEWTRNGLLSFAKYCYDPKTNTFKPMFTDGTDLSNYIFKRDGYFGKKGESFKAISAENKFLLSYARGFLITKDIRLWEMARSIAKGNGLGDLGTAPGKDVSINLNTDSSDALALFSILDLYRAAKNEEYLALARRIGNNIVKVHFNKGYFTTGPEFIYAKFDYPEPLALLYLQAAIDEKWEKIPSFINGLGYIDGTYEFPDGTVKDEHDSDVIYNQKRK